MTPSPDGLVTAVPPRSQIANWEVAHLEVAASRWRASATELVDNVERQRQQVTAPAGTTWDGRAHDAALDRASFDLARAQNGADIMRSSADLATSAISDLRAAHRAVVTAIDEAESDGFRVEENLAITDTRRIDITTMAARHTAANDHAENVRWNAEQLLATDTLIRNRLSAKAAELDGVIFDDAGSDRIVQAVDFKQSPVDEDDSRLDDAAEPRSPVPEPGEWPPASTPIEGGTPGGEPFPDGGLGEPVDGTTLPDQPEPPAWKPKDVGSGPFGSWEPRNPDDWIAKREVEAGAWWKSDEIPNAARNMEHYMDASGAPLQQDVGQMLKDIPNFNDQINADSQNLGAEAIARAQAAGAAGPVTFPVNTNWNGMAVDPNATGVEKDWYLATGNFDYNMSGQVTVFPPADGHGWRYEMSTDVNMRDQYNWDIGKSTPIMGTNITDSQMARFHLIGYAQEFTMHGSKGIWRTGG